MTEVYRVLTVLSGAGAVSTLTIEKGLELVEQFGIFAVLSILCVLFFKLWRQADDAKNSERDARMKAILESKAKLEQELQVERAKNNP